MFLEFEMCMLKLVTAIFLFAFSLAGCSQTNSQSKKDSNVSIPTAQINNSQALVEPKHTEVESVVKEWNGKVGSNYFRWDGKDLTIILNKNEEIRVFSDYANRLFRQQIKEEPYTRDCQTSFYYRPLAIAGSLVVFQAEWGLLCGAISTYAWGYVTTELAENGRFHFHKPSAEDADPTNELGDLNLSDIFLEDDIFKGLMANERVSKEVSRLISYGNVDKKPENLAELKGLLERFRYDIFGGMYYFDDSSFESFAIHHIEGGKVCVWVSLSPGSRAGQAMQDHLEIFLPIPKRLEEPLIMANSLKEGFLMKDAPEVVGTRYASFEFGIDK